MPAFIKTPHDEELWKRAKARAREQGRCEGDGDTFWAYVNGIYQRMAGHKGGSMAKAFADPFPGRTSSGPTITRDELIRAVGLALTQEEEAIATYQAQAAASPDSKARKLLNDIADEERKHSGELTALLQRLTGHEEALTTKGYKEAQRILEKALTSKEQAEVEKETETIRANAKKPEAKQRHHFKAAQWTHANGHLRCLVCGHEEPLSGWCNDPQADEKAFGVESRKRPQVILEKARRRDMMTPDKLRRIGIANMMTPDVAVPPVPKPTAEHDDFRKADWHYLAHLPLYDRAFAFHVGQSPQDKSWRIYATHPDGEVEHKSDLGESFASEAEAGSRLHQTVAQQRAWSALHSRDTHGVPLIVLNHRSDVAQPSSPLLQGKATQGRLELSLGSSIFQPLQLQKATRRWSTGITIPEAMNLGTQARPAHFAVPYNPAGALPRHELVSRVMAAYRQKHGLAAPAGQALSRQSALGARTRVGQEYGSIPARASQAAPVAPAAGRPRMTFTAQRNPRGQSVLVGSREAQQIPMRGLHAGPEYQEGQGSRTAGPQFANATTPQQRGAVASQRMRQYAEQANPQGGGLTPTTQHRHEVWKAPDGRSFSNVTFVRQQHSGGRDQIHAYYNGTHLGSYDSDNPLHARAGYGQFFHHIANRMQARSEFLGPVRARDFFGKHPRSATADVGRGEEYARHRQALGISPTRNQQTLTKGL